MGKLSYPDFFNHVFGPVMQPGSSGAFAGVCRIGNVARALVPGEPRRVRFAFNPDHRRLCDLVNFMSDRGYIGGVLGLGTDDERLFSAHELAAGRGLAYDFAILDRADANARADSVRIRIEDGEGGQGRLWATSVGGGMIMVHAINGFAVEWQADSHAVLVEDPNREINGETLGSLRRMLGGLLLDVVKTWNDTGGVGYFIETSKEASGDIVAALPPANRLKPIRLPALLPVVSAGDKKPQLFRTVAEWRQVAEDGGISFVQAAIEYEKASSGWTEEEIWRYFGMLADLLRRQIHSLGEVGVDNAKDTPLLPIYGRKWDAHVAAGHRLCDDLTARILGYAFSTNAKLPGVRIVPGPMGTGGGYLFSALFAVHEMRGFGGDKLLEALVVAAGLGALAYTHTNASGQVGCVGETGVCCAMAAGATVWLAGGDGRQVENAASMALQAHVGIPCDPIAGGLEFPCITRTLRAAVTAPLYADLALAGIDPLIPYHEMLQEIERHYSATPARELCGPTCGCNRTPTADRLRKQLEETGLGRLKRGFDPVARGGL
ncbi:MAG: L-serine ammonia-lyase, iron-sulfur-dependent, subunit alpha [Planctomycetota bacterium]|jgi:L-serine dehydratase|nr:L-serine ammonia-lyase, iron-sulfur-dependent, subunit alpha [Planctomycetota bacterium]